MFDWFFGAETRAMCTTMFSALGVTQSKDAVMSFTRNNNLRS